MGVFLQLMGTTPNGQTGLLAQLPAVKEPKQELATAPTRLLSMVAEIALK